MELTELKKKSLASRKHNSHTPTNMDAVCLKVKYSPGHTAYWHYGKSVSRSFAYAAFSRAERHGLIISDYDGVKTTYTITTKGEDFLSL